MNHDRLEAELEDLYMYLDDAYNESIRTKQEEEDITSISHTLDLIDELLYRYSTGDIKRWVDMAK